MIIGIGVDVVLVTRFKHQLTKAPALRERLFTPAERELNIRSLAARFAAKEAIAKALGAALHRPAVLPAPAFAMRAVLGEFAMEVLGGQRVVGDALRDSGYQLIHGDLDTAVRWLVS